MPPHHQRISAGGYSHPAGGREGGGRERERKKEGREGGRERGRYRRWEIWEGGKRQKDRGVGKEEDYKGNKRVKRERERKISILYKDVPQGIMSITWLKNRAMCLHFRCK